MNDSEEPDGSPGNSKAIAIIEPATGLPVPAMISAAGERARLRFIDFFTADIRNRLCRRQHLRADAQPSA
jgi:hypothetical protein